MIKPDESQTCIIDCPESWDCEPWTPIFCPLSELQTRTCTDANSCGTTADKPDESQTCIIDCPESWSCTDWNPTECPLSGIITRTCTDANSCGTTMFKPDEERTCIPGCPESWICTSWNPNECPLSGLQARACIDINNCGTTSDKPDEERECIPGCPESWSCTEWAPVLCPESGIQTRECTDANNCGATSTKPDESQTCISVCPESWGCTEWNPIECPESEIQTRACTDANSCGTTIIKPDEERGCIFGCPELWTCTDWDPIFCPLSGIQTRTCTDANSCGATSIKPDESQTCTYVCPESWDCTSWAPTECPESELQTRACTDANSCGTTVIKPEEERGCIFGCPESWICTSWAPTECPLSGLQTRTCIDTNNCGATSIKPDEERECIPGCTESWDCTSWAPAECLPSEIQTRACTDANSCGTTASKPDEERSCMLSCPESWGCTEWAPTECPLSGLQTRACTDANSCGTTASKPEELRTCIPGCPESWDCTSWAPAECPESELQTRTCIDANNCGATSIKPDEERTCTYVCPESWDCTDWSPTKCPKSESQTRACTDANNCGTTANKPDESQTCIFGCLESWTCTSWAPAECPKSEILTRTCTDANSCGATSDKPDEERGCTYGEPIEPLIRPKEEKPIGLIESLGCFIVEKDVSKRFLTLSESKLAKGLIPKGYEIIVEPFNIDCDGDALKMTLTIPENYEDVMALRCKGGVCGPIVTEKISELWCGDDLIEEFKTRDVVEPELIEIGIKEKSGEIGLGQELASSNYKVTLLEDKKVKVDIGMPGYKVEEPKNKILKIISTPLVVNVDSKIKARISMPLVFDPVINKETITIYELTNKGWKRVDSFTEGKEVKAIVELDGKKIFSLIGEICINCEKPSFEKVYEPFKKSREAIILVHGLGSSPATFRHFIDDIRLTNQPWQAWVYGYPISRDIRINAIEFANYLELHKEEFDKINIVAHSLGGLVAQEALRYGYNNDYTFVKKVDKVVLIAVPNDKIEITDILTNLINYLVNAESGGSFNIDAELIKKLFGGYNIPRVPGINYYVIAGSKTYEFNALFFKVTTEELFEIEEKNDGVITVRSAQHIGGTYINDSCRDYWELNLTHRELLIDPLSRKIAEKIISGEVFKGDRTAMGYTSYYDLEISDCDSEDTYVLIGKKIPYELVYDPTGCACGNGYCGEGEDEFNCPTDCARILRKENICNSLPFIILVLLLLLLLTSVPYVFEKYYRHLKFGALVKSWLIRVTVIISLSIYGILLASYLYFNKSCVLCAPGSILILLGVVLSVGIYVLLHEFWIYFLRKEFKEIEEFRFIDQLIKELKKHIKWFVFVLVLIILVSVSYGALFVYYYNICTYTNLIGLMVVVYGVFIAVNLMNYILFHVIEIKDKVMKLFRAKLRVKEEAKLRELRRLKELKRIEELKRLGKPGILELFLEYTNKQLKEVRKGVYKTYKPIEVAIRKAREIKPTGQFKKLGKKLAKVKDKIYKVTRVKEKPVDKKLLKKEREKLIEELREISVKRVYKPYVKPEEIAVKKPVTKEERKLRKELDKLDKKIVDLVKVKEKAIDRELLEKEREYIIERIRHPEAKRKYSSIIKEAVTKAKAKPTEKLTKLGKKLAKLKDRIYGVTRVKEKPIDKELLEEEHKRIIEEIERPSVRRVYKPYVKPEEIIVKKPVTKKEQKLKEELDKFNKKITDLSRVREKPVDWEQIRKEKETLLKRVKHPEIKRKYKAIIKEAVTKVKQTEELTKLDKTFAEIKDKIKALEKIREKPVDWEQLRKESLIKRTKYPEVKRKYKAVIKEAVTKVKQTEELTKLDKTLAEIKDKISALEKVREKPAGKLIEKEHITKRIPERKHELSIEEALTKARHVKELTKLDKELAEIKDKISSFPKVSEKPIDKRLLEKEHKRIIGEIERPSVRRVYKPSVKEITAKKPVSEKEQELAKKLIEINSKLASLDKVSEKPAGKLIEKEHITKRIPERKHELSIEEALTKARHVKELTKLDKELAEIKDKISSFPKVSEKPIDKELLEKEREYVVDKLKYPEVRRRYKPVKHKIFREKPLSEEEQRLRKELDEINKKLRGLTPRKGVSEGSHKKLLDKELEKVDKRLSKLRKKKK